MKKEEISKADRLCAKAVEKRADQRIRLETRRLEEEIELLQKRLKQIGPDGDCGYENAMIRFFNEQIDKRRERLATDLK